MVNISLIINKGAIELLLMYLLCLAVQIKKRKEKVRKSQKVWIVIYLGKLYEVYTLFGLCIEKIEQEEDDRGSLVYYVFISRNLIYLAIQPGKVR